MKLIEFLTNIKRIGAKVIILDDEGNIVYHDRISSFFHWIHNGDYCKCDINMIDWWPCGDMAIRLEEADHNEEEIRRHDN